MIGLSLGVKVHLCTQPTGMRRGFDGLSGMAQSLENEKGETKKVSGSFLVV